VFPATTATCWAPPLDWMVDLGKHRLKLIWCFRKSPRALVFFTGLALVNTSQTAATVRIEVDLPAGSAIAPTTITVNPGTQFIGLLSVEIFGSAGGSNNFLSYVPSGAY
jgi:hypothetical protein